MEHFKVMYDSRGVIYEHKMFIRLATDRSVFKKLKIFKSLATDFLMTKNSVITCGFLIYVMICANLN